MLNLQPGQKLSGFEVKGVLGAGGMGAVYLVWDPGLQQSRALKVIKITQEQRGSKTAQHLKARFLVEARTLAALDHPGIIRVYHVGEIAEQPYLVMEYFPGQDLGHWLSANKGRLPVDAVVHVLRQLAQALQYAHELDNPVIHRDIKLGNALLSNDGSAKLIDFGLAKSRRTVNLTQTGMSVGTEPYWAPEYVADRLFGSSTEDHTALTDLWALGVTAYVLLTNNYPIYDTDPPTLYRKITEGEYPPIRRRRSEVSTELQAVLHKLLAVDPEERHQSARAFIAALDNVSSLVDPAAQVSPPVFDEDSVVDVGSSMLLASIPEVGESPPQKRSHEVETVAARSAPKLPLRAPLVADMEMSVEASAENPFASRVIAVDSLPANEPTMSGLDSKSAEARNPVEAAHSAALSDAFASQISAVKSDDGSVIAAFASLPSSLAPASVVEAPSLLVAPSLAPTSAVSVQSSVAAPAPSVVVAAPPSALSAASVPHQPSSGSSDPFAAINSVVAALPSSMGGAPPSYAGGAPSGSPEPDPPQSAASTVATGEGEAGARPDSEVAQLSVFGQAVDGAINFAGVPSAVAPAVASVPSNRPSSEPQQPAQVFKEAPTPSDASLVAPAFQPKPVDTAGRTKKLRALLLPFAAAAAIGLLGLAAVTLTKDKAEDAAPAFVDPDTLAKERTGRQELERLDRVPQRLVPRVAMADSALDPAPAPTVAEPVEPAPKSARKVRRRRTPKGKADPAPAAATPAKDDWAARYGTRSLNAAGHAGTSETAADSASAEPTTKKSSAAGTRVPARLRHEIASSPAGPVIATVTKTTNLGGHKLKAGTELHGRVGSVSGTRVLVSFTSARLKDGTTISLRGRALARDGRAGLKGRRTLGGASDVASSALEAGARSAVNELGNVIGDNPAGAAVKSGGNTASGKSRNLNSAESVVVVKKSSRFIVYIDSVN